MGDAWLMNKQYGECNREIDYDDLGRWFRCASKVQKAPQLGSHAWMEGHARTKCTPDWAVCSRAHRLHRHGTQLACDLRALSCSKFCFLRPEDAYKQDVLYAVQEAVLAASGCADDADGGGSGLLHNNPASMHRNALLPLMGFRAGCTSHVAGGGGQQGGGKAGVLVCGVRLRPIAVQGGRDVWLKGQCPLSNPLQG